MATDGWSSLPADLLKEVSARLSSEADHLHFHQVCAHWRASSSAPAAFRPWVLAGCARWCGLVPISDYSLRLPRRGAQKMDVGAPPAGGLPYCCGTSRGWLALTDHARSPTRLVLWEPLSNTEISLPCQSPLTRVFLSDDPLASSNWIAIATQLKGLMGQKMLFLRPGDAAWTMMYEEGTYEVDTIAFHQGKAYYIDDDKNIIICDLNVVDTTGHPSPPKCTRIYHVSSVVGNLCRCDDGFHPVLGVHLVTCNGELLLVVLRSESHPTLAEVYKPQWTPEQRVELRERVMDLGDYSLFLGRGDTFALSAKEFPMIKSNCVYYAEKPCFEQHWISVFHLGSNVVEEIPYSDEEHKQDEAKWTPYVWFCPRKPFLKHQESQAY